MVELIFTVAVSVVDGVFGVSGSLVVVVTVLIVEISVINQTQIEFDVNIIKVLLYIHNAPYS